MGQELSEEPNAVADHFEKELLDRLDRLGHLVYKVNSNLQR